jgi:arabinogalactan oligomer/maltooligosaccharide transport system permease protein
MDQPGRAAATAEPVAVAARGPRPSLARTFRETGWRHVVGLAACVFALFPFVFVLAASLNADDTLAGQSLLPRDLTFRHYRWLFTHPEAPYPKWLFNSIFVAVFTASGTVIVAACGAYAFSRLRFTGRRPGLVALLLAQMFPTLLLVVAVYLLLLNLGESFGAIGLGTRVGLILVYLGGALGGNLWLMKSFFDTLPFDLDESAKMDGASHFQTFVLVILPLAAPILATIFFFSFIFTINEYPLAAALLQGNPDGFTLPYGLSQFIQGRESNWGRFAAGAVIAGVPIMLVFQVVQRYLVSGLTSGAVKG